MLADSKRIIGLDVLRAIAVLAVVISHTIEYLYPLGIYSWLQPVINFLSKSTHLLGLFGVELFFGLSGYLIGGILIKTYNESNKFTFKDVTNFWKRRWYRTLPNYWLVLSINILLYFFLKISDFEYYQIFFYFFGQNFCSAHPPYFFGEAWSLSVEEWFYLLLPLLFLLIPSGASVTSKAQKVFGIIFSYILVFTFIRYVNAQQPLFGTDQDFGIRKVVVLRLDALIYGVLWSAIRIYNDTLFQKIKNKAFVFAIFTIPILYYVIVNHELSNRQDNPIRMYSDAFIYTIIPLVFSCLLPYAANVKKIIIPKMQQPIIAISKLSYSIYLVHYSLLYIPFFYNRPMETVCSRILLYGLYWIILLVLSYILYKNVEKPFMRLRDKKTQ